MLRADKARTALRKGQIPKALRALFVLCISVAATWTATASTGSIISVDEYRDGAAAAPVVYLDFWASWCTPCKQSFPFMNDVQKRYAAQGLKVVAVNLDTRPEDVERFLKQVPAEFTIVLDPKGELAESFAVPAMPTSYLLDAQGKVIARHEGFRKTDVDEIQASIEQALRSVGAN